MSTSGSGAGGAGGNAGGTPPRRARVRAAAGWTWSWAVFAWSYINSKPGWAGIGLVVGLLWTPFASWLGQTTGSDWELGGVPGYFWHHPVTLLAIVVVIGLLIHFIKEWGKWQDLTNRSGEIALALGGLVMIVLAINENRSVDSDLRQIVARLEAQLPGAPAPAPANQAETPAPAEPAKPAEAAPAAGVVPTPSDPVLWAVTQEDDASLLAFVAWYKQATKESADLPALQAMRKVRKAKLTDAPEGWKAEQERLLNSVGINVVDGKIQVSDDLKPSVNKVFEDFKVATRLP